MIRATITYRDGAKTTRKFVTLDDAHCWFVVVFTTCRCAVSGYAKAGYRR